MTLAFAQVPDQLAVVALDPGSGRFGPSSDYVFDCWTPIVGPSTVLLWRAPGAGGSGGWQRVRSCRDGGHLRLARPRHWHGQERHRAADDRPHGGLRAGAVPREPPARRTHGAGLTERDSGGAVVGYGAAVARARCSDEIGLEFVQRNREGPYGPLAGASGGYSGGIVEAGSMARQARQIRRSVRSGSGLHERRSSHTQQIWLRRHSPTAAVGAGSWSARAAYSAATRWSEAARAERKSSTATGSRAGWRNGPNASRQPGQGWRGSATRVAQPGRGQMAKRRGAVASGTSPV